MKRWFKKVLLVSLIGFIIALLGVGVYLQQPKFGKLPEGLHLDEIKNSPNYYGGEFQNLVITPQIVEESNLVSALLKYLFSERERSVPIDDIPSIKTNLKSLDKKENLLIWFGHSSFYMQLGGKRILIDPVFSSYAAPVSFANKAFKGTNLYTAEDMPEIDYLLISHDHWDHLDYSTVVSLKTKVKNVVCGLGVGSHLENWGYSKEKIHEADWFKILKLDNDLEIHVLPARHFSGRLLNRNKTLWVGFALITPDYRMFFSGDSGYGPHFEQISKSLKEFDLVILDSGQYDKNWPYVHMNPEEAAQAAEVLQAKTLLPAHIGRFSIANHSWDEPFERIVKASAGKEYRLITPMIGEVVELKNSQQEFNYWWQEIK